MPLLGGPACQLRMLPWPALVILVSTPILRCDCPGAATALAAAEIGSATCRERECNYVQISVVAVSIKTILSTNRDNHTHERSMCTFYCHNFVMLCFNLCMLYIQV